MAIEKIRVRKYLQGKVEHWAQALEISESEFLQEAIKFYIRHLEGGTQQMPNVSTVKQKVYVNLPEVENEEDFTGDIDL